MIIDGSNWGFAASSTRVLKVGEQETQGVYGFIRSLRASIEAFSILTPIVVNDGVSWRHNAFPEYKANRGKAPETKAEIEQQRIRLSYRSQKPLINKALELLGVKHMVALNLEADDLAAILVRRYKGSDKRILLMSGDKDWIQLINPNVSWFDVINDRRVGAKTMGEKNKSTESIGLGYDDKKTGEWISVSNGRQWLECKALMGDKSDEIGGVGGIGEKGGIWLLNKYGSVGAFLSQYTDGTIDAKKVPKKLRDFADLGDKQVIFRRNMMLMDLNSPAIPKPEGLKISAGKFDLDGFAALCEELMFKSILTDVEKWAAPFAALAAREEERKAA